MAFIALSGSGVDHLRVMFGHLFDQALREKFLQSTARQGTTDLQPFGHDGGCDQPVAGDLFVKLVISGLVKEDQVV